MALDPTPHNNGYSIWRQGHFHVQIFLCDELKAKPDEGYWRLMRDTEPNSYELCHTATGERHALNADLFIYNEGRVTATPDGSRVILFTDEGVFVYSLEIKEFFRLKDEIHSPARVVWIDNEQVIVSDASYGTSGFRRFYHGYLHVHDSLEIHLFYKSWFFTDN